MAEIEQLRQLVEAIVLALVDDKEAVQVEVVDSTFKIVVDSNDLSKVIGKRGETVTSLRVLVSAVASKLKTGFAMDIATSNRDGYIETPMHEEK